MHEAAGREYKVLIRITAHKEQANTTAGSWKLKQRTQQRLNWSVDFNRNYTKSGDGVQVQWGGENAGEGNEWE